VPVLSAFDYAIIDASKINHKLDLYKRWYAASVPSRELASKKKFLKKTTNPRVPLAAWVLTKNCALVHPMNQRQKLHKEYSAGIPSPTPNMEPTWWTDANGNRKKSRINKWIVRPFPSRLKPY